MSAPAADPSLAAKVRAAREQLDAHVRDIVRWHFSPDTGTPFWLERAKSFKFDPLKDVQVFDDLKLFGLFEDDWLRCAPGENIERWVPRAHAGTREDAWRSLLRAAEDAEAKGGGMSRRG